MSFLGSSVGSLEGQLGMASSTCVTLAFMQRESEPSLGTSPARTAELRRRGAGDEEDMFVLEDVPSTQHVPKGLLVPDDSGERWLGHDDAHAFTVAAGRGDGGGGDGGDGGGGGGGGGGDAYSATSSQGPALRSCMLRRAGHTPTPKSVSWSDRAGGVLEERHRYPRAYTAKDFHKPSYSVMDYVKSFVSFISFL